MPKAGILVSGPDEGGRNCFCPRNLVSLQYVLHVISADRVMSFSVYLCTLITIAELYKFNTCWTTPFCSLSNMEAPVLLTLNLCCCCDIGII